MIAVALGLVLSAPACRATQARPPARLDPTKVYTFPLTLPDRSLICVDTPFDPEPPCITLGRLRRMVREASAN